MAWWTTIAWAAAPATVVALGDGVVAGPPAAVPPEVAGAWVTSLVDCLEERRPAEVNVVDRTTPGETATMARKKVAALRELDPDLVIVTLGAQELADDQAMPENLTAEIERLIVDLRPKKSRMPVLLVGVIPPTLAQAGDLVARQEAIDARAAAWNRAVGEVAKRVDAVTHIDLWAEWPRGDARAAHTEEAWHLSEQGHARVAAAVCDVVIAQLPVSPPEPRR